MKLDCLESRLDLLGPSDPIQILMVEEGSRDEKREE